MNSLIPEVLLLLRRAERLLTDSGQDYYNNLNSPEHYIYRRWQGENVEITRFTDGDFHIKITDPYYEGHSYAMLWRDETLKVRMDLVAEVNNRLGKIMVLDDLANA